MNKLFIPAIAALVALAGCTSLDQNRPADQSFGLGSDSTGTTVNLTGLGKHEVVQYFKSREGMQCFDTFSEYFKMQAAKENSKPRVEQTMQVDKDIMYLQTLSKAFDTIESVSNTNSNNMRVVALAAHGFAPSADDGDNMLAVMKATCSTYGYFDWKRDQDTKQYAFWTAFQGNFWKTTKVLGVGHLIGDTAKHALDAAATKYDVGGNLTQVGGNQDNTQNQAGGTCSGTVVDGTCVTPIEEVVPDEGGEEPVPEQPVE